MSNRVAQNKKRAVFAVENANHIEQNAQGQEEEHFLRTRIYVRRPGLIQFDCGYHSNYVHKGCVFI